MKCLTVIFFVLIQSAIHAQVLIDPYAFTAAVEGNNLLTNLAAYYEFEEAAGDNALDSSANGRTLTVNTTLESVAGAIGNARYHDSADDNDYFSRADEDWMHFGSTNFTVAFWYSPNAPDITSNQDALFVGKGDRADFSWLVGLDWGAYPNDYAFTFYASTNGDGLTAPELLNIPLQGVGAQEYFIWVRREANVFTMGYASVSDLAFNTYTDTDTVAFTIFDSSSPMTVGTLLSGGLPVSDDTEGWIDQLGIWNTALSDCQLQKLFMKKLFTEFDSDPCI